MLVLCLSHMTVLKLDTATLLLECCFLSRIRIGYMKLSTVSDSGSQLIMNAGEWLTTIVVPLVSVTAFIVSLAALWIARKQLEEAKTANGGRGLSLYVRPLSREDVSPEEALNIDTAVAESEHDYIPFLLTFAVTGPASFYQIIPYTWGEDGFNEPVGELEPIAKLDYTDGTIATVALIQKELVDSIWFGLAWLEPRGGGLAPSAIRLNLNDEFEEWHWRNYQLSKLPGVREGYWKKREFRQVNVGPLTQPKDM